MSILHNGHHRIDLYPGQCRYQWHWEDVVIWCSDNAIPGGTECAECLIRRAQAPGFVPSLPERRLQTFPARLVDVPPSHQQGGREMSARDWAMLWLIRHGGMVHQRLDPACVYRNYRPKPGSRLDRASRGLRCPRCFRRRVVR